MNQPEIEEREHLTRVTNRLRQALQQIDARLKRYAEDIQEQKTYLWESRADMDHVEKISTRQSIEQAMMTGETVLARRTRLQKLLRSPYFGRFDFVPEARPEPESIYVGVHHFSDGRDHQPLVYDWRAPIATMFYDYETGPARYEAPSGEVRGEMLLKRQFRICDGHMEFMLESAVNIMDDVLQKELSRASDEGLKNIVATIQRDQNAIIRDADAQVLIIQGVAGSGKTSIALHRIAFLLYRFKESLTSKDILIISPNRVFADYISNVLPELGEESVSEIGMETLADELLDQKYQFQTFVEQTAALLDRKDAALRRRIEVKASPAFLKQLDEYADHVERTSLEVKEIWLGRRLVPAWFIEETFKKHRGVAAAERIGRVLSAIQQNVGIYYNHDATSEEKAELRAAIRKMFRQSTLRATYKNLFTWMEEPELFRMAAGAKFEYADVFPLIYLKMRLEGLSTDRTNVKHLLIDEMQDYTPVQYAVIAKLFTCKKTILGDAKQAVNPYSSSTSETIRHVFPRATCVKLCKSYRSTTEITQFAQRISPDPELVAIERHGPLPQVLQCDDAAGEIKRITSLVNEFSGADHNTLAIICKTQPAAERLFAQLRGGGEEVHLLDAQSRSFSQGVTVCTAHFAKGLEFDEVVIPHVSKSTYQTVMDRNLLYVACTRAMHKLTLTFEGEPSAFLPR